MEPSQNEEMEQLNASIDQVTVIERQITPLMLEMVDGLEQFIKLDMPFDLDTRLGNIDAVRNNLDRSDVTAAEAFRQVLELYSIELQYGRGIESYTDSKYRELIPEPVPAYKKYPEWFNKQMKQAMNKEMFH